MGGVSYFLYATGLFMFFMNKKQMLDFIHSLGPFGVVGFILLQALQVVFAPIPGEATGLLGGFLYGPFWGTVISTVGLTIGSYGAFALSRTFGRPFVERFVDRSIMKRFDYILHHKGAFLVFILFLIPGFPKDYLCYMLGLGHLTMTQFLIIGGTGRLVGTILLSIGGDFIQHEQYLNLGILTGAALVIVLVAMIYKKELERFFRVWHVLDYRKRKTKKKEGQDAPPGPD